MSRIKEALRWDYGIRLRHGVLMVAVAVLSVLVFEYSTTGDIPILLNLVGLLALLVIFGVAVKSPVEEVVTMWLWSLVGLIGTVFVSAIYRELVAPGQAYDQFWLSHFAGPELLTMGQVTLLLAAVLIVPIVISLLRNRGSDGGNGSPEKRVLSEEEWKDFEPLDDSGQTESIESNRVGV